MVHEATVAEPDAQHHRILSSGTVSLGNQIDDAHSQSDTKPLYTFSFKAHGSTAAPMSSARVPCGAARVDKFKFQQNRAAKMAANPKQEQNTRLKNVLFSFVPVYTY